MVKKVKLRLLSINTIFVFNGVTYKKGNFGNDKFVRCEPKFGGQWQSNMTDDISLEEVVQIDSQH